MSAVLVLRASYARCLRVSERAVLRRGGDFRSKLGGLLGGAIAFRQRIAFGFACARERVSPNENLGGLVRSFGVIWKNLVNTYDSVSVV